MGVHVLLQPAVRGNPFEKPGQWKRDAIFFALNDARPHFGETSCGIIRGLINVSCLVQTLSPRVLQLARTKFPFYGQTTAYSNGNRGSCW